MKIHGMGAFGQFLDNISAGKIRDYEYLYFRSLLGKYVSTYIDEATVPQLRKNYRDFYDFIVEEKRDRQMPGIGKVWAERCHGFAVHAPESFRNFREAETSVGLGTDGGTGTGFAGAFEIEFDAMLRYGFSNREILRIATLGNMEIIKMQDNLGSIEKGKLADMLLLDENPLENIMAMTKPIKVFKEESV